jgi:hypothetical protein
MIAGSVEAVESHPTDGEIHIERRRSDRSQEVRLPSSIGSLYKKMTTRAGTYLLQLGGKRLEFGISTDRELMNAIRRKHTPFQVPEHPPELLRPEIHSC